MQVAHYFARITTMHYNVYKESVILAPVHLDMPMELLRKAHLFILLPLDHLPHSVKSAGTVYAIQ